MFLNLSLILKPHEYIKLFNIFSVPWACVEVFTSPVESCDAFLQAETGYRRKEIYTGGYEL